MLVNGDYPFGNGAANLHRDTPDCVAQAVVTRLRLLAGEWFLDLAEGTPYVQGVWGRHTQDSYDLVLRARILDTQGVTEILSYDSALDPNTRQLTVRVEINTQYGPTKITEVM